MLTNRSAPPATVTPVLVYPDVRAAVAWLESAFGFEESVRMQVVEEVTTWEYGERSGVVEDIGGHRWELTQTVRDVEPEEWGGTTIAPW